MRCSRGTNYVLEAVLWYWGEADTTCYWYGISDANVIYQEVKRFAILGGGVRG